MARAGATKGMPATGCMQGGPQSGRPARFCTSSSLPCDKGRYSSLMMLLSSGASFSSGISKLMLCVITFLPSCGVHAERFGKLDHYYMPYPAAPRRDSSFFERYRREPDPANNRGLNVVPQLMTKNSGGFARSDDRGRHNPPSVMTQERPFTILALGAARFAWGRRCGVHHAQGEACTTERGTPWNSSLHPAPPVSPAARLR